MQLASYIVVIMSYHPLLTYNELQVSTAWLLHVWLYTGNCIVIGRATWAIFQYYNYTAILLYGNNHIVKILVKLL